MGRWQVILYKNKKREIFNLPPPSPTIHVSGILHFSPWWGGFAPSNLLLRFQLTDKGMLLCSPDTTSAW